MEDNSKTSPMHIDYKVDTPYHLPAYVRWLHRAAVCQSADGYTERVARFTIKTEDVMMQEELEGYETVYLVYREKEVESAVRAL